MECHIISGGKFYNNDEIPTNSFIIAIDKGYEYCLRLGIVPNILVGDLDSLNSALIPTHIKTIISKPEKDDTDTLLGVKIALEKGFSSIHIHFGLGGRFDHSLANISLLKYIHNHGAVGKLYGNQQKAQLLPKGEHKIPKGKYRYTSIFPFDKSATVTLKGVKYPLESYQITSDFPIGVSNEILDNYCTITVFDAPVLMIQA